MKCNVCGSSAFIDMNTRKKVRCAECGSLERTRLLWMYLQKIEIGPSARVLHLAPERGLYARFREMCGEGNYVSADINPARYGFAKECRKLDLCDLDGEPDCHYDLIVHSHVLEHVPCNIAYTLFHLHRMLKPEGLHVCVIPFMPGRYDECFEAIGADDRTRRFGQFDHVRRFGAADIPAHLGSLLTLPANFDATDDFPPEELLEANITESHWRGFHISTVLRLRREDMKLLSRSSGCGDSVQAASTGMPPRPAEAREVSEIPGPWCPGWHMLAGTGLCSGARLRLMCITEEGKGEPSVLPLGIASPTGTICAFVLLRHPATQLQVKTDGKLMESRVRLRFSRIGRIRALIGLLVRARIGPLSLLTLSMAGGTRFVGAALFDRYECHLSGTIEDSADAAVMTLRPKAWLASVALRLVPSRSLKPWPADSTATWESTGNDPSFRLCVGDRPMRLNKGWYRIRLRLDAVAGQIAAPALYPDYGDGYAHGDMIQLPEPDEAGRIDAIVLLKHQVQSLRFDPTNCPGRFLLRQASLAGQTRFSALMRMLLAISRQAHRPWRDALRLAAGFLRATVARGLSAAADELYSRQPGRCRPASGNYAQWLKKYDAGLGTDAYAERHGALHRRPKISILLPVYGTPERWLRRCLESVLRQACPRWELCVADDASTAPHVRRLLEEYARRDPRVRVVFRTENGHISEASNSALALATGDFIGLLDHDDELRPHALLEMAEAIAAHPQADLLYSDEDKIDAEGTRFQPNFKPDWNYDLLLSQNYVCHFTVIRTELVRAVGGFRKGFEGSQDHDLFLRCIERSSPERIHHVPKVLYHWRAIEGSTALARGAKDYAANAGQRAVSEHLQRVGAKASVELLPHGHYRVRWQLPEPAPRVSLIVPTRDRASLLRACVESVLRETDYPDFEVLVVDNQSTDPEAVVYLAELAHRPQVRVLRYPHPFNYSAINNWAAVQAAGSVLCLLNNDIEVIESGWLREMVAQVSRPDIGAVGAMLYYPDRTIQHAGVILGIGGIANHAFQHQPAGSPGFCARALVAQNLSAVTGACLVVRRAVFDEVGGFDERLAVAFNDIDLCLRIREAGYRNLWTPFAELVHHESVSRGADDTPEKRARFESEVALMQARWGDLLLDDPAYNPNLTLEATDFGCAFPPRR